MNLPPGPRAGLGPRGLATGTVVVAGAFVVLVPLTDPDSAPFAVAIVGLTLTVAILAECWRFLAAGWDDARTETVEATDWPPEPAPERAGVRGNRTAGADVDDLLDSLRDPTEDRENWRDHRAKRRARQRLATLTTDVLAEATGLAETEVRRQRDAGEWTDDPRAAAFVGVDAPHPPLRIRVGDWLAGASYRRRLLATLDELEALAVGTRNAPGDASSDRGARIARLRENAWRHERATADDGVDLRDAMAAEATSLEELADLVAERSDPASAVEQADGQSEVADETDGTEVRSRTESTEAPAAEADR